MLIEFGYLVSNVGRFNYTYFRVECVIFVVKAFEVPVTFRMR